MASALTTELEAINLMLSVIGESPVNSDEIDGNVDAVLARQILHETSREVQGIGWHWNSYKHYPLTPDSEGHITVPPTAMRIDAVDPTIDVIPVGTRLYDRRNNTDTFASALKVDVCWLFDFETLPQAAREYINVRAARKFQDRIVGSETLNGFNREDELRARVALENYDANLGDYNLIRDSWDVGRIVYRNGTVRW
jgi:hypothetical protein